MAGAEGAPKPCMVTKDTGIKQEPTAPGAEGNDRGFPQVRDVTNKALMMVAGEAGATQHTNQLSHLTLPIMDKVNILLNDNKSEELEEVKPDDRENQNDHIYFKLTRRYDKLFLHCLQNQRLFPNALTMPVSEMVKRLDLYDYTYTFLELAWSGRRGRVYIEVDLDTTEARQFVDLCTGQRGSSFFNTRLTRVRNKGKEGECVFGGNYDSAVNRMLSSDGYCLQGRVMFMSHTDKSGEFIISTNDKGKKFGIEIGYVYKGLEVLQQAAQFSDITQVIVVDCGVRVVEN